MREYPSKSCVGSHDCKIGIGDSVKRGQEAIDTLVTMLRGSLIDDVCRDGPNLVIKLKSGGQVSFAVWGECVLPVQLKLGDESKPYYEGTFSSEGLVLTERGSIGT